MDCVRAAGLAAFLGGCSLFQGPGDYGPRDGAAPAADALGGSDARADALGPADASVADALCDAGTVCTCLTKSCSKELGACLANAGCSCGLACAQPCHDVGCYQACFTTAGQTGQDFLGCAAVNCTTDCF